MDTIDRLMDTAEAAIRQRGYHAVSFRDLADDLGIKSASVHYYFRQKEDLALALIKRYEKRFFAGLDEQATAVTTPRERLGLFCDAYRSALTGDGRTCLCGMLSAESPGLPPSVAAAAGAFLQRNLDWVAAALPAEMRDAERRGRAAVFVTSLQGAMLLAKSLGESQVFEDAAARLMADID